MAATSQPSNADGVSNKEHEKTPSRLPRLVKIGYGIGDLNAAIASVMTGLFLNPFLLDVARIRPATVGFIFLISKVWDAFTDPIVGYLADNTNTRFGRKRTWLLLGAIPFGIAFWFLWFVPALPQAELLWYFLIIMLLFRLTFTAVNVPYTALTPALTNDYDERTVLTTYRFVFNFSGVVAAVALHPILVNMVDEDNVLLGYNLSATVWAIVIVISAWITYYFTRGYEKEVESTHENSYGILGSVRIVFTNRPYLFVAGIWLLAWVSVQILQANFLLYIRYWHNTENILSLLLVTLQVTAFAFLPIWGRVSKRLGKNIVYMIGASFWLVVMFVLWFVQPGQTTMLFVLSALAGAGTSVAYLMPWSMLPDVIEYSELETGQRNEGVYYGFFVFLQKFGIAISVAISGFILEAAGYITPDFAGQLVTQPDAVQATLRAFVSLAPALLLLLSLPLAYFYPITRESFAQIQKELNKRRNASDV